MKKLITIVALVSALTIAGAYFFFSGREYVFRFSEAQLKEKLAERLPMHKRYFLVLDVTLDHPRLQLVEGSDRVNAGLDVTLDLRVNNHPLPLGGTIDGTSGVRYDAEKGQFFLTDPVIESLSVQGIPQRYLALANEALTLALTEYYSTRPIYTLKPENFQQATIKLLLKKVIVENQELVVTLGI